MPTDSPTRFFIISFPLGKDSIEYFSYKITSNDLRITLIKRGSLVYTDVFWDLSFAKGDGELRDWFPALHEIKVKTMTRQPSSAYNRYELIVPHQGGSITNLIRKISNNYYHIIIYGSIVNTIDMHMQHWTLNSHINIPKPKEVQQQEQQQSQVVRASNPPHIISSSLGNVLQADWRDVTIGSAQNQDIKLSYDKRTQGIALIGKNGTGKSSLIHAIINQELQGTDATLLLFDPHGDLAQNILRAGKNARKQVLWITPETTTPFGLNLFEANPSDHLAVERTVNVTIEIFKKLIGNDTTYMPRFEYIMGSVARTIIYANAGYTLAEVPLFLTDLQFSKNAAQKLTNPALRQFWQEYERSFWDKSGKEVRPHDRFMYLESVSNRISTLLQNELLYRIVSHTRSTIRFADLVESSNCIVFSLPMGQLGEGAVSLLGSILLAKFAEAMYQRGTSKRRVHVYIDEYGRYFSTPFTADLLTQGRKYNVSTLVTMQTLQQLPDEQNTAAVLNVGNLLVHCG